MTETARRLERAARIAIDSQDALLNIIRILDPIEGGAERIDLYTAIGQCLGHARMAVTRPAVRETLELLTTH